ncbi:heme biosynthesis HemY N-terminal domain-containing protein [Paraglaciecola aquimarina]|uniref:Heme biosynthesis HemY N-terminal domain-containing protein n=1 Tax=Paraglaciecola aquimarina TaxID=1235557 RepID=A0ABU3SU68_9ALTE|nr:heme biosynthesis HemY N-terminal domain-containing protein [Paraglaciecola aquimarina]MDU0353502.1 heme biosynthesis HemY N-terminal domain-containing protein [Paraglaciecola aquimarina]
MIRIFVVLVLLLIALMVGAMVFDDRGYVFVEFSGWVVEMNVFSLAISLIFIFVGFMFLNWLVKTCLRAASGSRNWLGNWGSRKKQKAFTGGLIALAETNYLEAQSHFHKIENEDFDGINLLAAAETEMQLGQPQKAQEYWRMASTYDKSALAANLCLIRHALGLQHNEEALTLIDELSSKQKEQPVVIKVWAQALAQAGKWQTLKDKLKGWKKSLGEDYPVLMQRASKGSFAEIASKQGAVELKQNWLAQPRATRKDPAQQAAYIQQLIDQGMYSDAEQSLVELQKSGPVPQLVPLFKHIKLPNPTASIRLLESWLKRDDLNVDLLSALAHVANASGDKVLAEKALGKAIKLASRQEDLLLMAEIKESQHDDNQALQLYKQSLAQQPR